MYTPLFVGPPTLRNSTCIFASPNHLWLIREPARGTTSKAEAQYQDKPKGISRCGFCRHFYSPDICEIVSEPVSREGWCRFYTFL